MCVCVCVCARVRACVRVCVFNRVCVALTEWGLRGRRGWCQRWEEEEAAVAAVGRELTQQAVWKRETQENGYI